LAAACAVELALLDALGHRFGLPLRALAEVLGLPPATRQEPGQPRPVTLTLDFSREPEMFARWSEGPPRHVKIKVGLGQEKDVARVRATREILGDSVGLAVDANMAWSLDEAVEMVRALERYNVLWYEEPLRQRALGDYRELRRRSGAKVMLDESLCDLDDAQAAIRGEACDLFNIRVSKCGGFLGSLRLAQLAHERGLGFQIGAQIGEMAILAAAGRQLAGAVRGMVAFEGSGVDRRFAEQITREVLAVDRQRWTFEDLPGAGLGITVDTAVLAAHSKRTATWSEGTWRLG
jgi:muconate cycloisomerase